MNYIIEDETEKKKIKEYVKSSFNITYVLLLTTGTITFIEALRTNNINIRHMLNLETCISVVAGYFYSKFITKVTETYNKKQEFDWGDLTKTRYIDWAITTPMMLLVLALFLSHNMNIGVKGTVIGPIIILNYLMLLFGYLGVNNTISKTAGLIGGFFFFTLIFYMLYINYLQPKYILSNYVIFIVYIFIWSFYGIFYMLDEEYKNIGMNVLDLFAKCFVGIGIWSYYAKVII